MVSASFRRAATPAVAAVLGALIAAGFFATRPAPVEAQSESAIANFFGGYLLNGLNPKKSGLLSDSAYQMIYTFPGLPCFVIRNESALIVVEVEKDGIKNLGEIKIDPKTFKEVVVLGDNQSFVVRHAKYVQVYSLDRKAQTRTLNRQTPVDN
jgi:hypothetical protein